MSVRPILADRVVLVAGGGSEKTGPATSCQLHEPFGVDFDRDGNMYSVEMSPTGRVLKVDTHGVLSIFGGTGERGNSGDGGPATVAQFNGMHSLAVSGKWLYIADTLNNRIRKIDLGSGVVTSAAGAGRKGFSGDGGAALEAEFNGIYSVAFDRQGEKIYLADLENRRIRMVDTRAGTVTTVAGNGQKGIPEDGAEALKSPLVDPRAAAIDSQGNVYVLERSGHALRVVDRQGHIKTVAGTGKAGSGGDGGDALKAALSGPKHLCVDAEDNVIIADTDNHVIRKYIPREHKMVRVAGSGKKGSGGVGGPSIELEMNQPHGVYVDRAGILYISDSLNDRILKIVR